MNGHLALDRFPPLSLITQFGTTCNPGQYPAILLLEKSKHDVIIVSYFIHMDYRLDLMSRG